jgi:hypothetical protein
MARPAGELAGFAVQQLGELEHPGRLVDRGVDLGLGLLGDLEGEAHVPSNRHVRVQGVALEHHGHVAIPRVGGGDVAIPDMHGALGGDLEPRDAAQQGGLSAAGGADEDDELSVGDVQVDALEDAGGAEGLGDAGEVQCGHGDSSRTMDDGQGSVQ